MGSQGRDVGQRRGLLVCIVLAVVIALFTGNWMWTAAADRAAAEVSFEATRPECNSVRVVDGDPGTDGEVVPVIDLGAGTAARDVRCSTEVTVSNASSRTVELHRMVLPVQGPESGAVLRTDFIDDTWSTGSRGLKAIRELDVRLESGRSTSFTVEQEFHPQGCTQGTMRLQPVLMAKVLRRDFETTGHWTIAFRHSGHTPGCAEAG